MADKVDKNPGSVSDLIRLAEQAGGSVGFDISKAIEKAMGGPDDDPTQSRSTRLHNRRRRLQRLAAKNQIKGDLLEQSKSEKTITTQLESGQYGELSQQLFGQFSGSQMADDLGDVGRSVVLLEICNDPENTQKALQGLQEVGQQLRGAGLPIEPVVMDLVQFALLQNPAILPQVLALANDASDKGKDGRSKLEQMKTLLLGMRQGLGREEDLEPLGGLTHTFLKSEALRTWFEMLNFCAEVTQQLDLPSEDSASQAQTPQSQAATIKEQILELMQQTRDVAEIKDPNQWAELSADQRGEAQATRQMAGQYLQQPDDAVQEEKLSSKEEWSERARSMQAKGKAGAQQSKKSAKRHAVQLPVFTPVEGLEDQEREPVYQQNTALALQYGQQALRQLQDISRRIPKAGFIDDLYDLSTKEPQTIDVNLVAEEQRPMVEELNEKIVQAFDGVVKAHQRQMKRLQKKGDAAFLSPAQKRQRLEQARGASRESSQKSSMVTLKRKAKPTFRAVNVEAVRVGGVRAKEDADKPVSRSDVRGVVLEILEEQAPGILSDPTAMTMGEIGIPEEGPQTVTTESKVDLGAAGTDAWGIRKGGVAPELGGGRLRRDAGAAASSKTSSMLPERKLIRDPSRVRGYWTVMAPGVDWSALSEEEQILLVNLGWKPLTFDAFKQSDTPRVVRSFLTRFEHLSRHQQQAVTQLLQPGLQRRRSASSVEEAWDDEVERWLAATGGGL